MTTLEEARSAWEATKAQFQKATPTRVAYLGDGKGYAASNMVVPAAPHLVYARSSPDSQDHFVVQNRAVQPAFNKPVVLGYVPYEPQVEQVLDFYYESILFNSAASAVGQLGPHRLQHEIGGGDEVFVDPRLFIPGLGRPTNPTSGCVQVFPFSYYYKEWNRFAGDTTVYLPQYNPVSGSRYVLVALDPDLNELVYVVGEQYDNISGEFSDAGTGGGAGGWGKVPAPAGNQYPLFAVKLTQTTSSIDWRADVLDNVVEARLHITPPFREVLDRISALENTFGYSPTLPTAGAEENPTSQYWANAALLRNTNIIETAPTAGQALVYNANNNSWGPSTISGLSGEANSGSNVGAGEIVYREKSGTNLIFKTLVAGTNITLASNASEITITSSGGSGSGEANTGLNLGTGIESFREKSGASLTFRTFIGGDNITISSATSEITIASTDTSNAAKNLGTGFGVFHETAGASHQFKSLIPGDNITGASDASTITLATTLASHTGVNLGTGIGVYKETAGGSHQYKTLVAGTNVTLASAASSVTITAAGGGGASPERHFNTLLHAPFSDVVDPSWNNWTVPIWQGAKTSNVLLNQFNVAVYGGAATSLTFTLEKRNWGEMLGNGTSIVSTSQVATPGGLEITSFNGNASILVDRQHLMFITGSGAASGGTVDFISITGYYTLTTASPALTSTRYFLLETGDRLLLETGDALLLENL